MVDMGRVRRRAPVSFGYSLDSTRNCLYDDRCEFENGGGRGLRRCLRWLEDERLGSDHKCNVEDRTIMPEQ